MQNDNKNKYLQLHFLVFIWGFTAILGELITLSALPLVLLRVSIASFCIYIYMKIIRKSAKISPKELLIFLIAGSVIGLHWIAFFHAIKVSNVSITLACISTGAFFTSILEPIFFKRKLILYEIILGAAVVGGLSLIFSVETQYTEGIFYGLLAAFLSASFSIINGKLVRRFDSVNISLYELIGASLFVALILVFTNGFTLNNFNITNTDWLWLILLSTICTAYPFIVSVNIMKYISPYTVMLTINLEPIYGIILAVIIFGNSEKMTPQFYLGAVIILITVLLNAYFKNKEKRKLKN